MLWFWPSGGYKTVTTRLSGGRVQVWVQVWAPASHLAISPKAVLEGNRRLGGQNRRPSSWGHSPALLSRVRRASTNTGRFQVGCSRCGPRQARMRKTCYYSCDTESVQESTRFQCFVNFRQQRLNESLFVFIWNENFDGIGEKLLPTKAAPIALLNLSISRWSQSKHMA